MYTQADQGGPAIGPTAPWSSTRNTCDQPRQVSAHLQHTTRVAAAWTHRPRRRRDYRRPPEAHTGTRRAGRRHHHARLYLDASSRDCFQPDRKLSGNCSAMDRRCTAPARVSKAGMRRSPPRLASDGRRWDVGNRGPQRRTVFGFNAAPARTSPKGRLAMRPRHLGALDGDQLVRRRRTRPASALRIYLVRKSPASPRSTAP